MKKDYNDLKIAYAVGFMLKLLKNKKHSDKLKSKFAAIRHGNYNQFIQLIGEDIPFIIIGDMISGEVSQMTSIEGECDFAGLLASGPSLDKFHNDCKKEFEDFSDEDFPDEIFRKLAVFEIAIRMHATNHKLIKHGDKLNDIIDKLIQIFPLTHEEVLALHDGRRFLNKIKHHDEDDIEWKTNVSLFENAFSITENHKILIQ